MLFLTRIISSPSHFRDGPFRNTESSDDSEIKSDSLSVLENFDNDEDENEYSEEPQG